MSDWNVRGALDTNGVTLLLAAIAVFSLLQGIRKGASGSARQLFSFLIEAAVTIGAVIAAAWAASHVSADLGSWISRNGPGRPAADAGPLRTFVYTFLAGLRDLPLFRFAVLFLLAYFTIRLLTGLFARGLAWLGSAPFAWLPSGGIVGRTAGGLIGAGLGAVRALVLTAVLFGYCSLFPKGYLADYIQQSGLYREVAAQVVRPAAGPLLERQLPVFAQAMTDELSQLWLRRYDIIDAEIPDDIVNAAVRITQGAESSEAKARALYEWVGTRIAYDYDKVEAYEQRGEWLEQTPEQTFRTRKGVCIDYARLYAAMARAAHLDARVVTGLGYDGRGGYGAHAWNEVYLPETGDWVPLDPTWAGTGDWFNPPRFDDTHIRRS